MAPSLLFELPLELLQLIIEYLQFPDTAHARATCRILASLIPAQSSDYIDLVAAEDSAWAVKRRRLVCVYCARMRLASAFTDRQKTSKPEFRSCVDCQVAEFGHDGWGRWRLEIPVNSHRTRLSVYTRKLKVDGVETGICEWCHNSFARWGRTTAGRAICSGCFLDKPGEEAMVEANHVENDMKRMGKECKANWTGFDGDDLDAIRSNKETGWWYTYEWDYEYAPGMIPVWRGGSRGVTVRSREEAENPLVIVDLEHVDWYQRQEAAQRIREFGAL